MLYEVITSQTELLFELSAEIRKIPVPYLIGHFIDLHPGLS